MTESVDIEKSAVGGFVEQVAGGAEDRGLTFSYDFSQEELFALAHLIRRHRDKVPRPLFGFVQKVRSTLYKELSIGEMEALFGDASVLRAID